MEENKLRVTIRRLLENSIYIGNLCVLTKNDNSKMDLPPPPFHSNCSYRKDTETLKNRKAKKK